MSKLSNVKRGRLPGAQRYLLYGAEGVGKSSLAAHAPNPIYLDIEDGSSLLYCARYPFRDEPGGHVAASYQEVLDAIKDLRTGKHAFESLVVDTVDSLQGLLWGHICKRDGKADVDAYGWIKGYNRALDEWRLLCCRLDELRTQRNMRIIVLGHAAITKFKNPDGGDYNRYSLHVDERAAAFFRGWFDVVGYCCFEGGSGVLPSDDKKTVGYSTGRRLMHFERTATHDAKTRIPLPGTVPLSEEAPWAPIAQAESVFHETPEQLHARIDAELGRIKDEKLAQIVNSYREGAEHEKLVRILTRLIRRR